MLARIGDLDFGLVELMSMVLWGSLDSSYLTSYLTDYLVQIR